VGFVEEVSDPVGDSGFFLGLTAVFCAV
jgi:hypothetical protein